MANVSSWVVQRLHGMIDWPSPLCCCKRPHGLPASFTTYQALWELLLTLTLYLGWVRKAPQELAVGKRSYGNSLAERCVFQSSQ